MLVNTTPYDLQIVTHCYAEALSQYATHLKLQLATLYRFAPKARVRVDVFFTPQDRLTVQTLDATAPLVSSKIDVFPRALPPGQLFRRAIGRNMIADEPSGRVVWFTDVDYLPGAQTCDRIVAECKDTECVTSQGYYICRDWTTGDEVTAAAEHTHLPSFDPALFAFRSNRIAIGGVQMIGAELLNRIGYLRNTRYTKPVSETHGFLSCRCDHRWRRSNSLAFRPIDTGHLYRVRHSRDGRDYTPEGIKHNES